MSHHRAVRARVSALSLTFAAFVVLAIAPLARAAAPSPKVLQNLPDVERSAALRAFTATHDSLRAMGVDKIYPQFALDFAKYPRQGVAHRNVLVVLCKFPGESGSPAQGPASVSTPRYFWRHLFSDDPTDGLTSLREYYRVNSHGRLIISGFVTSDWLEMPHSYAYYTNSYAGLNFGAYPRSAQKLAEDAMTAAYHDFKEDLSFFDNDGPDGIPSSGDDDGYVDAVMVIVPGAGGETSCSVPAGCQRLWAHESGIAVYSDCPDPGSGADCLPGLPLGNKLRGFLYNLGSEYNDYPGDNAVGTWIHEFSHTLGLPDLYDLTGGNGLGFFSLMAVGNYLPFSGDPNTTGPGVQGVNPSNLDAWSRQFLGFDNPTPAAAGHYTLAPVTRGGGSLKIWSNGEPGTEYFLVENRTKEGSDASLPGEGLLVYHVDDTKTDNVDGPPNYRVRVVEADNQTQLENGLNYGDPGDPFPGSTNNTSLTQSTSPSSRDFSLADTGIRITNIAYAADTVSFDLQIATKPELRTVKYAIDDGGGDGLPDPNESEQLTLTVKNLGLPSGPLTLTLSTGDGAVTLGTTVVNAPAIAAGATAALPSPFTFSIGSVTPPHDIHFQVNWTDGSSSGVFGFDIVVGAALGLSEDFESGEPNQFWETESLPGSSSNQWHNSPDRHAGGTKSAKVGSSNPLGVGTNEDQSYAPMQDAALLSPTFELPPNSQLAFDSYIDAETYGGTEAVDGARVEISMNGDQWIPLAVDGGYGYIVKFDSQASLRGQDVFSGSPQAWRHVTADLSAYSGEARIRFRFSSDSDNPPFGSFGQQIRPYEGWYVDNVVVQARSAPAAVARKLSLRGGPSPYHIGAPSMGSIQFRFSAPDGLPHPELKPVVRLFDVRGRLIRELDATAGGLVASEFHATWDAKDRNGQTCRAGIYFARVDIQGQDQNFRLVLLK